MRNREDQSGTQTHIAWKRWVVPAGRPYRLTEEGFLPNPERSGSWSRVLFGEEFLDDAREARASLGDPCTFLLGEAGMGKSELLRQWARTAQRGLFVDLASLPTPGDLTRLLPEHPVVADWCVHEGELLLCLDAVDESPHGTAPLLRAIGAVVERLPAERLRMVIASRSAPWSEHTVAAANDLARRLRSVRGHRSAAHASWELCPLRKRDVDLALKELLGPAPGAGAPHPFLDAVCRYGLGLLASRPLTLRLLLDAFGEDRELPQGRQELYLGGLRAMCAKRPGELRSSQRLAIAARIAAATVVCQRPVVVLSPRPADGVVTPSEVTASPVLERDDAGSEPFAVEPWMVTETVRQSGLFRVREASDRFGWVHRSFAECLAAHYFAEHDLSPDQLEGLLAQPGSGGRTLAPQLVGVAGWFGGRFLPEVRRRLLRLDPGAALAGDLQARSPEERADVVEALLDHYDRERAVPDARSLGAHLWKLDHPGLVEQLRRWLHDGRRYWGVRRVVRDITVECGATELAVDLARVALDPGEARPLRVSAAGGVWRLGDRSAAERLLPLLHLGPEEDPDDELRGAAISALWDAQAIHWDALLEALATPRKDHLYGYYRAFLLREDLFQEAGRRFGRTAVAAAVRWLTGLDRRWRRDGEVEARVLAQAVEHLGDPDVANAIGEYAWARTTRVGGFAALREAAGGEPRRLEGLLHAVLATRPAEGPGIGTLVFGGLLRTADADWLVSRLRAETDDARREALTELAGLLVGDESGAFDDLAVLYADEPERFPALRHRMVCDLGSPEADQARERHADWLETEARQEAQQAREEPPPRSRSEVVGELLEAVEGGRLRAWPHLVAALDDAELASAVFSAEPMAAMPGWAELGPSTRSRVDAAALRFIRDADPDTESWLSSSGFPGFVAAGVKAIERVVAIGGTLSPAEWTRWAPAVLRFALDVGGEPAAQDLIAVASEHALEALDAAFRRLLATAEGADPPALEMLLRRLKPDWPGAFRDAVLERLGDHEASPSVWAVVLEHLLGHGVPEAEAAARSLLSAPPGDDASRGRILHATPAIVAHDVSNAWGGIRRWLDSDDDYGRELLLRLADAEPTRQGRWLGVLSEPDLAALLLLLWRCFPPEDDAEGTRFFRPEDHAAMLRDRVLTELAHRGNAAAVIGLRRVRDELANPEQFRWILPEAEARARAAAWRPPTPDQVLALAASPDRRFVRDADALAEAVEQACRLGTPAAGGVWERVPDDAFRPVSEARLRQIVARGLKRALAEVVVGWEGTIVEPGSGPGLLRARCIGGDASADLPPPAVTIDIATSWDRDIHARPESLAGQGPSVLVLAWFAGRAWTREADHERRRTSLGMSQEETVAQLEQRTDALAAEGLSRVRVVCVDLSFSESQADFEEALTWAGAFLSGITQQGVEPLAFDSRRSAGRWLVRTRWSGALREDFGITADVLLLATREPVAAEDVDAARREIRRAGPDLDPDLLLVADSHPDLAARLAELPARGRPVVPVPATDAAPGTLSRTLRLHLPCWDLFDEERPVRGAQFFGRKELRARLSREILNGRSVGVFGLRRVGKTSLVRVAAEDLDPGLSLAVEPGADQAAADGVPRVLVAWLNVQGIAHRTTAGVLGAVAGAVRSRLPGQRAAPPPDPAGTTEIETWMRRALEVPPRRLCLVLDEYELLFEGTDGQPSVPGVGSFLRMARALSMETGRFSLVLIGRDDAWLRGPMLEGFPNPLLGWCADHVVGPLDRPEADELLTTLGARVGLRVGESSRHTAWRWTAGHVLLLRQFGSALLETAHRRGGTPSRRTDALCDEAVDAYLDRSKVRGITGDVLDLLSRRSPPAYALLRDLLASRKTAASFARHGGWHGEGARTLRRLGILLGSSADPFVSETLRIEAPFLPEPPATNQQEGQAA